jgi:hypothetical protein
MWYVESTGWTVVDDHAEPLYEIRYAESLDGLSWGRTGVTCIAPASSAEAIARPCVRPANDGYAMWYSYRGSVGFRTDPDQAYRIGFATSPDGLVWCRRDDEAGVDRSDTGWDSIMTAYPWVYESDCRRFMLYNGNGFGRSGLGYAVLEDE